MSQPVAHCPFLNRSDHRCSEMFNLDRMQHAFKFCFDRYKACPRYAELLAERQARRASGLERRGGDGDNTSGSATPAGRPHVVVQLTLPARLERPARAAVPVAHCV